MRAQYANDRAISDYVLSLGYAFAATDKGNTGADFFTDGVRPGDAIVEWNERMTAADPGRPGRRSPSATAGCRAR